MSWVYEGIASSSSTPRPCRGSTNSAGFAIAWTGNRGSVGSLAGGRVAEKAAGDIKTAVGDLKPTIWWIVGCLPVITGPGCCVFLGAGLLISGIGAVLRLVGLDAPKEKNQK